MKSLWKKACLLLPAIISPAGAVSAAALIIIAVFISLQSQLFEQQQTTRYLLAVQQDRITSLNSNLTALRSKLGITQKDTDAKTAAITKELQQAQSQQQAVYSQTREKITTLEQGINAIKPYDTAKIISEWRVRIAYIECQWQTPSGAVLKAQSGSGILTARANGEPEIVTNAHVLRDSSDTRPTACGIQFPDYESTITVRSSQFSFSNNGYDWGRIDLSSSDNYVHALAAKNISTCSQTPSVGAPIVILGYPGIGSQTDITATEGIISGYDGNYYITSAKVEHGNSGGAAIMLANDCYLGIPTFVESGGIESLARILKSQLIFPAIQ